MAFPFYKYSARGRLEDAINRHDFIEAYKVIDEYRCKYAEDDRAMSGSETNRVDTYEAERNELLSPEYLSSDDLKVDMESKDFALVVDMCNQLCHLFQDGSKRTHNNEYRRISQALFGFKDSLISRFAIYSATQGLHCGKMIDRDRIPFFGAFIEGIGEVRWHLGNERVEDAFDDYFFSKFKRPVPTYQGKLGKSSRSNADKLMGDITAKEYEEDKSNWAGVKRIYMTER